MNITDYPQLRQILEENQKIVYLCGAGVSMALGAHRTNWGTWLQNGKRYLNDAEKAEFDRIIGSWTADSMIDAAGFLLDALKRQGTYHDYMRTSFSGLTIRLETMASGFSQIHRAGDYIATTNYDLLLEQAACAGTVTYADAGRILQMLRGEVPRQIIHLHGAYDPANGIDDIIADNQQYQDIVNNAGAQFIQNLIGTHPIIILGCGATVDDPNLSGFLTFVAKHLRLDVPYFYVHKDGDDLSHLPGNMIPVCYGSNYDDLPSFLAELAAYRLRHRKVLRQLTSIFPYTQTSRVFSAFGRLHFSNEFSTFVGRRNELKCLDDFCAASEQISWWAVTGEGGMGKSRLLHLRIMFDQGRGAGRCWDKIKCYAERFPDDETLTDCLAEAGKEWGPDLVQKRLPKRYRRMAEMIEFAYTSHSTASIAADLATILANEYFLSYRMKSEFADAQQTMQHCASALRRLHQQFPEEPAVIRAYACIASDQHFDRCMFSGICADEIQPYQAWHEQYPGDQEIAESYAKMLYVRRQYLLQQGNRKEAKHCVQNLTALGKKFPFREDDEGEQWIHSIIQLIQDQKGGAPWH